MTRPVQAAEGKGSAPSIPELLAPAGNWECARAAIENGADAIYFGLSRFNARMRADNFTLEDLPKLMPWLHARGARGYVTFNTLIFQNELETAREDLHALISNGVDAAIVQDVGICRLIRSISPDFPIHASTQMTVTSPAGVEFARQLGCQLIVLARECSLRDISTIREACEASATASGIAPIPLEVFVHGALCVAYSGQCLTSESLGGRSANRGECAQACRMPYTLLSDGQEVALEGRRYLLSPQDLSGLSVLPELISSGVRSLKIEGRLKSPEYVANVTQVYRRELDRLTGHTRDPAIERQQQQYRLEMAFSRGLHTGWFGGIDNQQLVHARFGKKRGVRIGNVKRSGTHYVDLIAEAPIKAGDGIVFDQGSPETTEQGGRVYSVRAVGTFTRLEFGRDAVDFTRIKEGDLIWKTDDPDLNRELRKTYDSELPRFTRPLDIHVSGSEGHPLAIEVQDEAGHRVRELSSIPLAAARTRPLTVELLREQLGRLGGTPFHLNQLDLHIEGSVMLPLSELNALRRRAIDKLLQSRVPTRWQVNEVSRRSPASDSSLGARSTRSISTPAATLAVLVRNMDQLKAAMAFGVADLYCEFENPKSHRDAVESFKTSSRSPSPGAIWAVPPRIFKPGEEWILNLIRSANPDGFLVRNYDHFRFFKGERLRGDFSLNTANSLAAEYFTSLGPLERVTASYDLNHQQLEALLLGFDPERLELTLHQHMPMFHMEHCVFCAFLSKGKDYRDCGRPCDRHEVRLRDRVGQDHPLKADAGCRNTLFNALAQTGAEGYETLRSTGARHFRIEFLDESSATVTRTLETYTKLFRGELSGAQVWRELKILNQLGVTRGATQT